ncbi:hypothetical protein WMY93_005407 [Mugilogobius chulae]|uniref:Pericentriolar material 1 protein C-terminal domain-containing protein n=1 Tax=Mugilogobius chulae TaxID=88201 RepID=A0AAW0PQP5_9GOBI
MATGESFNGSTDELHNWTVTNGSLECLNNMDWGVQQKKANRSSEKNKKKLSASVVESRLTNDISPESTPGAGRRRARTPHSFPHIKYTTQMSVPDQAELDKLRQRINFTDLDEQRSVGSDSQGRVTAANNQRQLACENKKPYNFLPLHVNTNKKELLPPSSSAPATPAITKATKKQSPGHRDTLALLLPTKDTPRPRRRSSDRDPVIQRDYEREAPRIDRSQVVSKLVQIREGISKANSMLDDLVKKNDVPANVERLSLLIEDLKEQERSYLRFLQKMLSGRAEAVPADQKEELENLRKQHELLKKMLEQQEQLRALQGRQEALMAMQHSAEQALAVIEDTGKIYITLCFHYHYHIHLALSLYAEKSFIYFMFFFFFYSCNETTGSVSGISITSELNDELNDLIQRFHNQLKDSRSKAVPDNRRQAESLSLSREVSWSRSPQATGPSHRPLLHSGSGPHSGLQAGAMAACAKLTKLQELQDKKQTMDKILQELHSLRDQTLNNNSCRGSSVAGPSDCASASCSNGASASTSFHPTLTHHQQHQDGSNSTDKLRKLKEVHKRLNELRELVQYYEQTSDMMVDAVNVKEDDEEEEDETEDGSMFDTMFDSEQENRQPVTNIRNPQRRGNWSDLNSLTNSRGPRSANNRDGRLNTECEINNRSAANLRSLNIPSAIACQYNRDSSFNHMKDDEDGLDEVAQAAGGESEASGSSRRSSLGNDGVFAEHQTAKQKLRQLQELVAMVQSDDTDGTTANEDESLHQQPNNTRATGAGAKQNPRDTVLSSQAGTKLYEEKLRQQKEELKQLHEERQRLIEIQDKIQDLQWACPDLQSSLSSATSQQGLLRKAPIAISTPAAVQVSPCSGSKSNSSGLKATPQEAATSSVTDNELWSEMRRDQIIREELRQRRKHLECLMAEHQRRSGNSDSTQRTDDQEDITTTSLPISRDERTMATWGSTPCNLDDDDDDEADRYHGMGAEEEEEHEGSTENSSDDEFHIYSNRNQQRSYSNRNNQGCNLKPPSNFSNGANGHSYNSKANIEQQQSRNLNQSPGQPSSTRRQENLRWASDLSFAEGSCHWQEQVGQLQRQLDFSTSMCQTLLQDQQTLSYMLQTLLTGQYSVLPNNVASPQVHLIMHQLSQCYTQLAWQQNNVQRLKQVLNDLLHQQMQASSAPGWQTQKQGSSQDSCSVSPGVFPPFSSSLPPPTNNMPAAALSPFAPDFPQGASGHQSSEHQKTLLDPNLSMKTEYMSFPPPLQRPTLNTSTDRGASGWLNTSFTNNCVQRHSPKPEHSESPSSSPIPVHRRTQPQDFDRASQESFSSMPDPADPTTVTKTFKTGRKACAQANLASRSKTPNQKRCRRRNKVHNKNSEGQDSDTASSSAPVIQERAVPSRQKIHNQTYAWRTPFLSNRIACTEAPDASSDFSLFEALRETIYSEVAALISQNESRPHFLIELFHELQLLNTDYLRQRALYSLQDIVTRHLTEKSAAEPVLGPVAWAAGSQSELTPSESVATSDAEVVEKNLRLAQNRKRDDAESVGNDSIMSTSSNLEPFANDDLGAAAAVLSCPQIDTQPLDRQIKAIMTEVIPSSRRTWTSKEFVRFFHRQLGGLLQDSLNKFVGRTLKECGEDLLVEISEVLFNELAFFKLMQNLDSNSNSPAAKHKNRRREEQNRDKHSSKENANVVDKPAALNYSDEDKDYDEAEQAAKSTVLNMQERYLQTELNNNNHNNMKSSEASEAEEERTAIPLSISLSKAETQALTNYGSGEDENDEEEVEEFEAGPVDVQTSLQVTAAGHTDPEKLNTTETPEPSQSNPEQEDAETHSASPGESSEEAAPDEHQAQEEARKSEIAAASDETNSASQCENVLKGPTSSSSPDTDSPVMINVDEVGSGSTSQKSDEDDFVKVDDLPLQLTVMCEEELQKRIVEEQQNNNLSAEILNGNTEGLNGLVGNDQALKEPEAGPDV